MGLSEANSTSFKKGNTAALGNDKTIRLSTWIDKVLDEEIGEDLATVEGYDSAMQKREFLARKYVNKTIKEKDVSIFRSLFSEIADRTEGKAKQYLDHTTDGEKIQSVLFVKPEKQDDIS